jgi:aminocarboxymuconate-semialdehyde decarboxylase
MRWPLLGSEVDPDAPAARRIDVHTHLFPQSAVRALRADGVWFGTTVSLGADGSPVAVTGRRRMAFGSPRHLEPPEVRIARMRAMRVDTQVVSLLPPLFRYEIEPAPAIAAARAVNDELAGMQAGWPERYIGLATLPLQDVRAAVAELERAMTTLGLRGIAIGTHVDGRDWDDPELFPVLEAAATTGALIFCHPLNPRGPDLLKRYYAGNLLGNPWETTMAVAAFVFGGVLDRLPGLELVFAHGGGYAAAGAGRMDHGARVRPESRTAGHPPSDYLRRLYFDSLTHSPTALGALVETVGAGQVLLGSDYPADMGDEDPVGSIQACDRLSDDEKVAIGGGNLARMLGLPAPAAPGGAAAVGGGR